MRLSRYFLPVLKEAPAEAEIVSHKLMLRAGMIRQLEVRPDRVHIAAPVGTLTEFLAVRLILERFALAHVAREELDYHGPLKDLREAAWSRVVRRKSPSRVQRAHLVFQLAQLLGWTPSTLHGLSSNQWTSLIGEIATWTDALAVVDSGIGLHILDGPTHPGRA